MVISRDECLDHLGSGCQGKPREGVKDVKMVIVRNDYLDYLACGQVGQEPNETVPTAGD